MAIRPFVLAAIMALAWRFLSTSVIADEKAPPSDQPAATPATNSAAPPVPAQSATTQRAAAPPADFVKRVAELLPQGWKSEIDGSRLLVRPPMEPVFVNLVSTAGPRQGESLDDFKLRHRVQFDYRIALRCEPALTPDRVRQMIEAN